MDNAVTTTASNTALLQRSDANPGLGQRWQALPAKTQVGAALGVAALLAVLVLMLGGARDADYRVLFPNLSDKDGGAIIEKLTQLNVPYKFSEGGSTILVPASRVHELRMKLASGGLPSAAGAGSAGYELLDKNNFGQTQGQERMKMQRAIEGELTTTIQAVESVKSARVHLALPQQNGFFREQLKPSASVVLTLHPGRTLDRGQVAGIVKLVSGSVPDLSPKAVSVVDSTGALLSGAGDEAAAQGLDSQQLQYRRDVEASHHKRVLALLEPVVGRDNVRASISAEIDFSQVMQTAEAYGPNQGASAKAAVREQRSEESNQPGGANAAGVPGATANQPPVPAQAPINGASAPLQGGPGAGALAGTSRRDAATRFEVDKTVTVTKAAVGNVRRLNAAVVINHRTSTDAKGKTSTVPLSDKEIEQLTALVQQGIGFNSERGDVVKIVNAPFRVETVAPVEDTPVWKQPWLIDLLRSALAPLALALVALTIVFKLIKPALTAVLAPPPPPEPGTQVSEVVGDSPGPDSPVVQALEAPQHNARLEAARAMAKENPAAVAGIVRGWVNGEAAWRKQPDMAAASDDAGLEDAAILLMLLGEEEASGVFKHLAPKEVQRLGETIARMKAVSRERVDAVFDNFEKVAASESMLVADSNEYVKSVLRKALGDDKANLLIDRILQGADVTGIESLKWMDPQSVAELLRNEHPQIVAAILVHLEYDQAAAVLKQFSERHRNEVMVRVATLDGIQPTALRDLNEVMSKVLAGGDRGKKSSLGGAKTAAEILNMMGSAVETSVLDFVREADNDLAQKIMDNMFTFDDVEKLDDKGIQALMKEVQSESLVVALKGATPALRDKIFKNMSSRAAETLKEDLDSRGPVRLSEVEAEQKEMLKIVRRLVDEGQIVMAGGGDEQFV